MDNLTHSVAGLAVGELVHRSLPVEPEPHHQATRRRLLLITCWAASNFPDLDIVLTPMLPAPLGYLLHHRGHTHTLLYALPQALLLWLLIRTCWPAARMLLRHSSSARSGFFLTLAIGFVLHLAMDFLNSYGIHPFYPFDSRWLYGDMVFIIEPLFWIAFGVPVLMTMPGRLWKVLVFSLLAATLLYFTARGFLGWPSLMALLVIAAFLAVLQHLGGERGRGALAASMAIALFFVGTQYLSSSLARNALAQALRQSAPRNHLMDAAMTAFPSNPVCWSFVSVEANGASEDYILRRGVISIAPGVVPIDACPPGMADTSSPVRPTPAVVLAWENHGSMERLRRLRAENCYFEAWLRFARAPSVSESGAVDARFATTPRGNFTAIDFAQFDHHGCPEYVPQWAFPREDLLGGPPNETQAVRRRETENRKGAS